MIKIRKEKEDELLCLRLLGPFTPRGKVAAILTLTHLNLS